MSRDEASICLGKNAEKCSTKIYYKMNGSSGVFQEKYQRCALGYHLPGNRITAGMILVTRRAVGLIWKDAMRFIGINRNHGYFILGLPSADLSRDKKGCCGR